MLIKPNIPDETIFNCLQQAHGLHMTELAFLPIGGDLGTAVYRAVARDGTPYFVKLRGDNFDPLAVELPQFLHAQGVTQIIQPLASKSGDLWVPLEDYHLILYPFIDGTNGFELQLSASHWAQFGAALRRIHSLDLPLALRQKITAECYTSEWRERCLSFLQRLDGEVLTDPIQIDLRAYLLPRRDTVLDQLGYAGRLADILSARSLDMVLCHSDIHPGNLFMHPSGSLFIIDWDYPMLAPKERDLMFIGGGQGYVGITAEAEETNFYRYYGQAPVDPQALAYYRCERNIIDICVECSRIFSSTVGDSDRRMSLQIITWLFGPGGSVEMAYKALKDIPS
jgi:spectinomycin phosphotransferase